MHWIMLGQYDSDKRNNTKMSGFETIHAHRFYMVRKCDYCNHFWRLSGSCGIMLTRTVIMLIGIGVFECNTV